MCTIVLASRVWNEWPVVVAANRDEALGRASEGPSVRVVDGARILAPKDLVAGGTWLGVTDGGLFVGITNRYDPAAMVREFAGSRGTLVEAALAAGSAEAAAMRTAEIDPAGQGPFHLLMADRDGAFLVWSDLERLHRRALPPGIHVVTERSFDAAPTSREPLLARLLEGIEAGPVPSVETWRSMLSRHGEDPLEGTCVHADDRNYGTRSSTLVSIPHDGAPTVHHADGPPCTVPYADLSALAKQL